MKKKLRIFIMSIILLFAINCNAQITLDTIVPMDQLGMGYGFKTVQISKSEIKYFWSDTVTNTFSLYNMDWTPFLLNIAVPEPFQTHIQMSTAFQVLYITRTLFDCDSSNIEYAYYNPGMWRKFYIMRTDGNQLFEKDSANGPYGYGNMLGGTDFIRPIINTPNGAKLFLQNPQHSKLIYTLCGSLPTDVFDFNLAEKKTVKIYPNPSSNTLTFEINLPDNLNQYELVIIDMNANQLVRRELNSQSMNYSINVENFNSGTYLYSVCSKNKAVQTGKFIITKH